MKLAAERAQPAVLALLALGVAGMTPLDNPDTFGHLATGRQIAQLGHVPKLDTFSYFRPEPAPFLNYEWLSDWLFFACYRAGAALALCWLKLALLTAFGAVLLWSGWRREGRLGANLVSLFMICSLPGLRFRLSVRPELFGLLFGAFYLLGLREILLATRPRRAWAWVVALALMHALWVNLHGSHLLGLAFIGIACACSVRERAARPALAGLLALALLASCASPYGPAIVTGAIAHVFDPAYRTLIDEWRAWRPTQSLWFPAALLWQTGWIALSLRELRGTRTFAFDALCALLLLLAAVRSLRFIGLAVALTTPLIAAGLAPRVRAGLEGLAARGWSEVGRARVGYAVQGAALSLALLICPRLPPGASFGYAEQTSGRPAASGQWLAAHLPRARVLAVMSDAWDLMFSLPHAQFLLDGRAPFYGPEHIRRVQQAWGSGRLLRKLIDDTGTDIVIAQPLVTEVQPALRALLGFDDFALVMIEDRHCVFARKLPERAGLVRSSALTTLVPGYAADWVLSQPVDLDQVARELKKLPAHPNVNAYRSWVAALVALKPLARAGGHAGIASPRTAAERRIIAGALALLRQADRELEIVPTVAVYHALAAIGACELDEAREAFARAQETGRVREVTFGEQELALRAGELEQVRTFIDAVRALPEAAGDTWLAALEAELATAPRCGDER